MIIKTNIVTELIIIRDLKCGNYCITVEQE